MQHPTRRHALASLGALSLSACVNDASRDLVAGDLIGPSLSCPSEAYAGPAARTALRATDWPQTGAVDLGRSLATPGTLDGLLAKLQREQGIPAIDAALWSPTLGAWEQRVGWRDQPANVPVDAGTEFWWASVGKLATAALVLLAEQRGLLRLSDPCSRWVNDLPQQGRFTVKQLLAHTSGLLTYNSPGSASLGRYQSPDELLVAPRLRGLLSCPGTLFSYSNTGYLLLARILEAVFSQPFHRVLEGQMAPQGLRALAPAEEPSQLAQPHDPDGRLQPLGGLASLLGAGNVVGSASGWVRLLARLLQGEHATLARRQGEVPLLPMGLPGSTLWYGLGLMVFDWRDVQGRDRVWIGHSGGGQHANAVLFWDPFQQVYGAVAVTSAAPAAAVATALLRSLESAE